MRYWRIQFDDKELADQFGWLEFDDNQGTNRLLTDDGNLVTEGISYTTIDMNPVPPVWGNV